MTCYRSVSKARAKCQCHCGAQEHHKKRRHAEYATAISPSTGSVLTGCNCAHGFLACIQYHIIVSQYNEINWTIDNIKYIFGIFSEYLSHLHIPL